MSSSLSPPALGPKSRDETTIGSTLRGLPGDLVGLEGLLVFVGDDNGVARCVDDEAAGADVVAEMEEVAAGTVVVIGSALTGSRPLTDLTTMR